MSRRRYTEQQFRRAVADPNVRTISDLCRAIGIVPRGSNYETVRRYAAHIGSDLSRLETYAGRTRFTFTEEQLIAAVADASSLADVIRNLGGRASGSTRRRIQADMRRLGLELGAGERPKASRQITGEALSAALSDTTNRTFADLCAAMAVQPRTENYVRIRAVAATSGLGLDRIAPLRISSTRQPSVDPDRLARAVSESRSVEGVLVRLGLPGTSYHVRLVVQWIAEHGLDRGHFERKPVERKHANRASASTRSKRTQDRATGPSLRAHHRRGGRPRRPIEELLVVGKASPPTSVIRERLIEEGLKERRCEWCMLDTWYGLPIPLELDHVNGRRNDNRLQNLRLLCPTCHALTPTYRGRNIGRADMPG